MENATTHTTDIAMFTRSIVTSMTTVQAFQVSHTAGSSRNLPSTSMPDEQHDISDALPHMTADLDGVSSGLSPRLTTTSRQSETYLDSIKGELWFRLYITPLLIIK
jgi:hypothetical protein